MVVSLLSSFSDDPHHRGPFAFNTVMTKSAETYPEVDPRRMLFVAEVNWPSPVKLL